MGLLCAIRLFAPPEEQREVEDTQRVKMPSETALKKRSGSKCVT